MRMAKWEFIIWHLLDNQIRIKKDPPYLTKPTKTDEKYNFKELEVVSDLNQDCSPITYQFDSDLVFL